MKILSTKTVAYGTAIVLLGIIVYAYYAYKKVVGTGSTGDAALDDINNDPIT